MLVIRFGRLFYLLILVTIFSHLKHRPHSFLCSHSIPSILIVSFLNTDSDPCTPMFPLQHRTEHIAYNKCKINICRMTRYVNDLRNYQELSGVLSTYFMWWQNTHIFRASGCLASNSKTYVWLREFPYIFSGCFGIGKIAKLSQIILSLWYGLQYFLFDWIKSPI